MKIMPQWRRLLAGAPVAAALTLSAGVLHTPLIGQGIAGGGEVVSIDVNLRERVGEMYPMWSYFGYDEANYTYSWEGEKLLTELAELSPDPVYIRAHQMLNTDEGPRYRRTVAAAG